MTIEQRSLPLSWRWAKLGDACQINPPRAVGGTRSDDSLTTFIPMSAVDAQKGIVATPELRPYSEVKRGYTFFAEGDVLFAKITPCMENGKHAIARNLADGIGFGSTEFHILRPMADTTAEWVHYFVRQPSVLQDARKHFTGAVGQQRVPEDYLASLEIPLPPLAEQHRLVAHLSVEMAAIERARTAAEEQLAAIEYLPAAILRQAFLGAL